MPSRGETFGLIEANVHVLRSEEGGRRTGIFTGYRPNWKDADAPSLNRGMGMVEIIGADELAPGATGRILIRTLAPELWQGLSAGSRLDMCEGPRVVGHVEVVRVIREPINED